MFAGVRGLSHKRGQRVQPVGEGGWISARAPAEKAKLLSQRGGPLSEPSPGDETPSEVPNWGRGGAGGGGDTRVCES